MNQLLIRSLLGVLVFVSAESFAAEARRSTLSERHVASIDNYRECTQPMDCGDCHNCAAGVCVYDRLFCSQPTNIECRYPSDCGNCYSDPSEFVEEHL